MVCEGCESNPSSRTGWEEQQIPFFIDGVLGCIANSFQQCGLASIRLTDDKNAKVPVFLTNFEGLEDVGHVNRGR